MELRDTRRSILTSKLLHILQHFTISQAEDSQGIISTMPTTRYPILQSKRDGMSEISGRNRKRLLAIAFAYRWNYSSLEKWHTIRT